MLDLNAWRRALVSRPGEEPAAHPFIDEQELADLSKWIAGAITLLAGLLTFLGMQGGALDRMLRRFPAESMMTFSLVGGAVVIGLLSAAIRQGFRIRLLALLFAVAVLSVWVAYTLPNIQVQSVTLRYAYPVYLALGLACALFWRSFLAMRGAALVLSLAMLGMGTYAAVKLSILSKAELSDVPRVSASVQRFGNEYLLRAQVRASALRKGQYVTIEIRQGDQHSWLRCDPDEFGQVDEAVALPVTSDEAPKPSSVNLTSRLCNADGSDAVRVETGVLEWIPSKHSASGVSKLEDPREEPGE